MCNSKIDWQSAQNTVWGYTLLVNSCLWRIGNVLLHANSNYIERDLINKASKAGKCRRCSSSTHLTLTPLPMPSSKSKGDTGGNCQCHFRVSVAESVCVCVWELAVKVTAAGKLCANESDDDVAVDSVGLWVNCYVAGPLTEYGLQHGRYEEHCFATKLVREVAGNNATCCNAK